ncbi:hypothetical protein ABTE83_20010, partial [Acinetobacter baumannii]
RCTVHRGPALHGELFGTAVKISQQNGEPIDSSIKIVYINASLIVVTPFCNQFWRPLCSIIAITCQF